MAGYKRFVSYIYEYQDGKKGVNKGFVKADCRNGLCRMQLQLQEIAEDNELQVYLYVRQGEQTVSIPLGGCRTENQMAECRFEVQDENILGSGYGVEQAGGMWLEGTNGGFYATAWDDEPVMPDQLRNREKETNRIEPEVRDEESQEEPLELFQEPQKVQPEASPLEQRVETAEQSPTPQAVTEASQEKAPEVHMAQAGPAKQAARCNCPRGQYTCLSRKWGQFCRHYNRYTPFSDEEMLECLQVAPKDMMYLRKEDWRLGKNTFVLQGYYTYQHLMLARRRDGVFLLGVPGTKENQEQFMAGMFGFPEFKEIEQKQGQRQQGYWLRPVG